MGSKTLCQETDVRIRKLKESLLKNYLQSKYPNWNEEKLVYRKWNSGEIL